MKLVSRGILAVLLCAGCAMEAGDPASEEEGVGQGVVTLPTKPVQRDSSNGGKQSNPEPSPWHGQNTTPTTSSSSGGTATNPNAIHNMAHEGDQANVDGDLIQPL
jgi:hypothetical protein